MEAKQRLLTAQARLQSRAILRDIREERNGVEAGIPSKFRRLSLANRHSIIALNRPITAA